MKKLLAVFTLVVAAFSIQANAASLTLQNLTSGNIDTGTNLVVDALKVNKNFTTTWRLTSNKDVSADVIITANPLFKFGADVFVNHVKVMAFAKDKLDKIFTLSFLSTDTVDFVVFGSAGKKGNIDISVQTVPVPAALWLFGSALGAMGFARRKKA